MSNIHKNAIAYSMTTLASSMMNSIFNFYYVKIFLNVYKISESWFNVAQVIFLIWNATNDPLFGYIQDSSKLEVFRNRRKAILYGAPLFALSFLLPWFPWVSPGTSDWLIGVHLVVSLCFYDALFTFVLLAHCALFTELSHHEEDRHTVLRYSQLASILNPLGLFVCVLIYNHEQHTFHYFQATCVLVALFSWLSMNYTGKNIILEKEKNSSQGSFDTIPLWTLTKQLLSQKNLAFFVIMNFFQVFHSTFQSNFFLIFADYLIGPDVMPTIVLSCIAGSSYILPQIVVLGSGSLLTKYGSYRLILWSLYIKFILATAVFMAGRKYIWVLAFMFLVDRTVQNASAALFNLPLSDIIDDDKETFQRPSPISSMIFGTNALFTKPAQSLAPMIVVFVLTRYGYQQKENTDDSRKTEQYVILQDVMFQLMCLVPMFLAVVQIVFWRMYTLRRSRYRKTVFVGEEAVI